MPAQFGLLGTGLPLWQRGWGKPATTVRMTVLFRPDFSPAGTNLQGPLLRPYFLALKKGPSGSLALRPCRLGPVPSNPLGLNPAWMQPWASSMEL